MSFEEKYKRAINLMQQNLKDIANKNKPLIPHLLRVGKYLYDNNYSETIVNAGLLHDLIEWTDNPEEIIKDDFGEEVYNIVLANTKNREIENPVVRQKDYVNKCAEVGKDALIVKSADTLDSYQYYSTIKKDKEMERSRIIARLILEKISSNSDPIFKELERIIKNNMENKYKNFDWGSIGFNFGNWEEELVWSLDVPVQKIDIEKLTWHLAIPYWNNDSGERWTVSPLDVIDKKPETKKEQQRVKDADTSYPLDLFENEGKLFVLDGLHRLVKLYKQKEKEISVRIIPKERFPEVESEHPFELPNQADDDKK